MSQSWLEHRQGTWDDDGTGRCRGSTGLPASGAYNARCGFVRGLRAASRASLLRWLQVKKPQTILQHVAEAAAIVSVQGFGAGGIAQRGGAGVAVPGTWDDDGSGRCRGSAGLPASRAYNARCGFVRGLSAASRASLLRWLQQGILQYAAEAAAFASPRGGCITQGGGAGAGVDVSWYLGRRRWTMQRQHRSASIRGVQCLLWLCMGKPMSVGLLVGRIPGRIRGTTLKVGAGSYTSTCRQQDIPHSVGRPQSRAEDGAGLGLRRSQIAMRWHTPGRLQCRGAENFLGYDVVRQPSVRRLWQVIAHKGVSVLNGTR